MDQGATGKTRVPSGSGATAASDSSGTAGRVEGATQKATAADADASPGCAGDLPDTPEKAFAKAALLPGKLASELMALKAQRQEMNKRKKEATKQLKQAQRKRKRLLDKAKKLSSNDLLQVYHMRVDMKKPSA